jgi:hypothetical protein
MSNTEATQTVTPISEHEGRKYLRVVHDVLDPSKTVSIDIYELLRAFNVTCPAIAHAVKKLLMLGQRGKGSKRVDLVGALAAVNRAVQLEDIRTAAGGE